MLIIIKKIQQRSMPTCFSCWSNFFRKFDLFPNSKLLRYRGDAEYTTTTGGLISIGVIIIFIILFASMGIKTLQKDIIFSSISTQHDTQPSSLQLTFGPQGNFMPSIAIFGWNINSLPKIFDVTLIQQHFLNRVRIPNSTVNIQLQACTQAHFNFNEQLSTLSQKLTLNDRICPALGQTITLNGKVTAQYYSHAVFTLTRCNSTTDTTCMNDTAFSQLETQIGGRFLGSVMYVNTNVNPGSSKYTEQYLEDQDIFYFSSSLGIFSIAYIAEQIIKTDVSVMPYEDFQDQNITRIDKPFGSSHFIPGSRGNLVQILFRKSAKTITYERGFNKLDAYFSYVGGLVGTIIGLIFIMEFYTEKAYEVSLAKKVLYDEDGKEISSRSFNILYYLSMGIKKGLNLLTIKPNWPDTEMFQDCCEEIGHQIDVTYLVRKMMFFDVAISKMMQKHDIEGLYLRKKPTIAEAKNQRRKHFSLELFKNFQKEQAQQNQGRRADIDLVDQNNLSKQHIMMEELRSYTPPKLDQNKFQDDISALELSVNLQDINQMKEGIQELRKKNKKGKIVSQQILRSIDPSVVGYFKEHQSQNLKSKQNQSNFIKISPRKIQEVVRERDEEEIKQENIEDFQYDFDKKAP